MNQQARERVRKQLLVLSVKVWSVRAITEVYGASRTTVSQVRCRFREDRLHAALYDEERSGRPPDVSTSDRQRSAALTYTEPLAVHGRWTVRPLA